MPATERLFTEIPAAHLYLDTNILLDHLVPSRTHHARANALVLHLAEHDLTSLYLATIAWTELAHVVTRQTFRDALSQDWQQSYDLAHWEQQSVRAAYLRHGSSSSRRCLRRSSGMRCRSRRTCAGAHSSI